jgi:hypothetical protein
MSKSVMSGGGEVMSTEYRVLSSEDRMIRAGFSPLTQDSGLSTCFHLGFFEAGVFLD